MTEQTLEEYARCGIPAIRVLAKAILSDREVRSAEIQAEFEVDDLVARAEGAEAERDAFREQHERCDRDRDRLRSDAVLARAEVVRLTPYVTHWITCAAARTESPSDEKCNCGLAAALKGVPS